MAWRPRDIINLVIAVSGCLGLNILVSGVVICAVKGILSAELLGSMKGIAMGSGLIGFALVLFFTIKLSIKKG